MKSEEVDRPEPQNVQTHLEKQPGSHTNTINASGSSKVLGNTMIGEQTNVFNQSAPTQSVVHHHHEHNTTRSIPVPVYIPRSTASKRASTVAQGPAPKRQKVTQSSQSRPSTSKQTVAKPKKAPKAPKAKAPKKTPKAKAPKKTPKAKAPKKTPKAKAPKKTPKTKAPKKTPQKKPKKAPKSKQSKSRSKPKKSKKK